eukprot:Gb_14495 [translate_table: standard]
MCLAEAHFLTICFLQAMQNSHHLQLYMHPCDLMLSAICPAKLFYRLFLMFVDPGQDDTMNWLHFQESVKTKHPQLLYESKLYRILQGGTGIPNIRWFGVEGDYNVLVMDLLGPSLEDLFNFCSRKFTLKTVLMLADQMVYIIDFGLAKKYRDPVSHQHIPYR